MKCVKQDTPNISELRYSSATLTSIWFLHDTCDNLLFQRLNAQVFTTEELSAGEKWQSKLRNELSSTDVVVALLTPHSADDKWVLHEIGAALALEKLIIPVVTRRDVLNKMPVSLERSHIIELAHRATPETQTTTWMRSRRVWRPAQSSGLSPYFG